MGMGRVWIGTSGFSYPEWRGAFYPADLAPRDFLRHYAARLNSVEIDSTFYRMPAARTLEAWKAATPERFRFAIKAPRRITHVERLKTPSESLDYFQRTLAGLGERLGVVLYQLPPNFAVDVDRLDAFLARLSTGMRCAFEFRHASWFAEAVYERLRKRGVGLCIRDADEGMTPSVLTAPFTLVRLRRSRYGAAALAEWRGRLLSCAAEGAEVFAYVKHEENPEAPRIAERLAAGTGLRESA
jgi:uncharacterized protein YecE (DUF72 family)